MLVSRRQLQRIILQFEDNRITRKGSDTRGFEDIATGPTNNDLVNGSLLTRGSRSGRIGIRVVGGRPSRSLQGDDLGHWSRNRCSRNRQATIGSCGRSRGVLRSASEGRANSQSRILEVREGVGCTIGAAVNGEHHSLSAMEIGSTSGLGTVCPDGLSLLTWEAG